MEMMETRCVLELRLLNLFCHHWNLDQDETKDILESTKVLCRCKDKRLAFPNWWSGFLKVSHMKRVMSVIKNSKLSPRNVGPKWYYELQLPAELVEVNLGSSYFVLKEVCGWSNILPLDSVCVKESITYEDMPNEILDFQVRWLRNKEVTSTKD